MRPVDSSAHAHARHRYATVLEKEGVLYLYMKTIERAHTPRKLWERVKLSGDYAEALKQIDKHLVRSARLLFMRFAHSPCAPCTLSHRTSTAAAEVSF